MTSLGMVLVLLISPSADRLTLTQGEARKQDEVQVKKSLVAQKLELAQKVLAAVAQNDYSMVEKHANALSTNSKDLVWQKIRSEQYEELGREYRRELDGLARAAKAKNNEAMALAYVKVSLACFRCHDHVREVKIAR